MGDKEPILTRAKIREIKAAEEKAHQVKERALQKEYDRKEAQIEKDFKKEKKKIKEITASRTQNNLKVKERGSILTKAIVVVSLLLVILFYFVFFW